MADIIHFKNTTLKVIRDVEPEFNIYMPNYEPEPYREFNSENYYLYFFIEEFPNGYGYGWDSNIISSLKLSSNSYKSETPEQAYYKAIAHLTKYYFKPHCKIKSLIAFLMLECQTKDLFSFHYT